MQAARQISSSSAREGEYPEKLGWPVQPTCRILGDSARLMYSVSSVGQDHSTAKPAGMLQCPRNCHELYKYLDVESRCCRHPLVHRQSVSIPSRTPTASIRAARSRCDQSCVVIGTAGLFRGVECRHWAGQGVWDGRRARAVQGGGCRRLCLLLLLLLCLPPSS